MTERSNERLYKQIERLKSLFNNEQIEILEEKPIDYGHQIIVGNSELSMKNSVNINVYYSEKKGVSVVVGGSQTNPLREKIVALLNKPEKQEKQVEKKLKQEKPSNWKSWIGTDEAGKGEFYGALVVAGFYVDKAIIPKLRQLKVDDSKRKNNAQIIEIAHQLYKDFGDRIETVVLEPETYNKLYGEFVANQKKLNELLAWAHGRVILNLTKKWGKQQILIDKFTTDAKVVSALKGLKELRITQRTKAESDPAVAAASIIARYHYLHSIERLEKKYRVKFPAGSGAPSISFGVKFAQEYSLDKMNEISKTHFKNYEQIRNTITTKEKME